MPSQIGIGYFGELIYSLTYHETHNFFYDLVFGPRLVHYVHTMENQGTVSHCRLLLLMFFSVYCNTYDDKNVSGRHDGETRSCWPLHELDQPSRLGSPTPNATFLYMPFAGW